MTRNQQGCQILKPERDEKGPDSSEDSLELDPATSSEQFMALLHGQALRGDLCCQTCISTQLIAEDEAEEMFQAIVGRVWDATGFRFTFVWFPLAGIEVKWLIFSTIQLDICKARLTVFSDISTQPLSRQEHIEAFVINLK